MMNWILLVMAAIASVVVAMVVGGLLSPRTRTATRTLACPRSVADVYACVRQADGPPRWCPELPTMRAHSEEPPHRVTFALFDDDGASLGTWVVAVRADGDRTLATITEAVTVDNPVLRFVRALGGNGARPQRFLEAVAGELDVAAIIT